MPKIHPAIELAAVLSAEAWSGEDISPPAPHLIAADAVTLLQIGARVKRWAERACNGIERYDAKARRVLASWTEADEAAKDKADARHRTQANLIAARYGATATIGGDPRGFVLRLVLASGRTNTTDHDGWGVA
ncbi:hypothetical protein [Xanthobacter flavus]|uniref:hypothetical protein n=1 Tax=Xanthobacter flavus TaxID=281 RepID=UPI0037280617